MLNSASIINCSFLHMKEELDQLVAGGTPMFHIDLMDGHYVPNLCMPIKLIEELKKSNKGNDGLQQKVTDYETKVQQLQAELEQTKLDAAIKVELLANKAVDLDYQTIKQKNKGEAHTH